MQILNAPGRFSTSPRLVAADARRQKRLENVSVIFKTEMADEARAAALVESGDGWTVTRKAGQKGQRRGMGECAILTRDDLRTVVEARWIRLSDGGGKGRLSVPNYAVVAVTRAPSGRVTVLTGAHLPAHIEGKWARLPMPDRVKVWFLFRKGKVDPGIRAWIESVHRWRAGVMALAAKYGADDIVAAPDGNIDAHGKWQAKMIRRAWPGMNLCVTESDDLGNRAVGWVLTTMTQHGKGQTYRQESSDHKAGRLTLKHVNPDRHQPKPQTPPPPFDRVTYNGALMDQKTKTFVQQLEKDLGYPLTILQGCYHPGVSQSAGTHDGGGVLDLAAFDWMRKQKAARARGGFYWHRLPIPGVWGEHIHGGIRNHGTLSPSAKAQQVDFDHYPTGKRNGLATHAPDPDQYPPTPRAFDYAATWHELNDPSKETQ